ncbi:dihydrodipicolinate synthase family protein [Methylobacterium nodulans]|uniref:Dihydrodipicolinate synthetase n=1 Tax=Methylobacterium nodulans (strain LMG 21967 / CNCM I-2342 / ORS 2060) TaxID=460265 RepID=B8IY15_METNO|nr:dihydrodipicolinate synthase family protein [Methylobacterium nodulans]ACL63305.1 dihydrodipicolinate synthetase [Methylobacterium nodulans ORS 2060]
MTVLKGLSAFPITPSNADGRVDVAALRRLLARLVEAGVDSIGLLGSTGSYPYFSRTERRRALEAAVDETQGRIPIMVGVGALRTSDAVRLAQDAQAIGAVAGLLAPVCYTPLNDDEVYEHFITVARESQLPLCIYDNPTTTHFQFSRDLVSALSRVPEVIAVKSPAPEAHLAQVHHRELRAAVPPGFSIGYSGDGNSVEALLAGGDAWYCVAGGLFPETCMTIVRLIQGRRADEARRLNAALQPLWDLFKEYSSLRVMYAAANLLGICRAQPPRPILPVPDQVRQRIGETLTRLELR